MSELAHPDELLPWYVNHTLPAAERQAVEAHLRGCERCSAEIGFLEALRMQVKQATGEHPPDRVGLQRLMREVRAAPTRRERPWLRPALAAAVAAVVVQAALIGWLWTRQPPIEPLGGPWSGGVVLQVRFAPAASEARIRALLQASDATIIDGPGALGVYRLRLRDLRPGDRRAVAKALAELRAARGVVVQAEAE